MAELKYIQWYSINPKGGGSFNGIDLGSFCKIGNQIFVVPFITQTVMKISFQKIEEKIAKLLDDDDSNVYTLTNDAFERMSNEEWINIIQKSLYPIRVDSSK